MKLAVLESVKIICGLINIFITFKYVILPIKGFELLFERTKMYDLSPLLKRNVLKNHFILIV